MPQVRVTTATLVLLPPLPLLLLLLLSSVGEVHAEAAVRRFYVAAVEIGWDYVHLNEADPASDRRGKSNTAQKYIKAVYREYTDGTYSVPKPRPAWAGIQGPVIVARAGDRVVVHFKNLASQPYSISPVGITYWKQSEGAGYDDSTAGPEKQDDAVAPGGYYEYVWDINPHDGPTVSDPECLTYSYSSQVDAVRDVNSGLVGALLICKSSALTDEGQRRNTAFVLLFAVFDETKSWYGEAGERVSREKFRRSHGRKEYHTINGYVNSTLPGLTLCQGSNPVLWHVIGMGTAPKIHSIRFQDHTLQVLTHRKVAIEVTPMTFSTAEMRPAATGRFLISCQLHSHRHDGMNAFFAVEKCPEPVVLPGPDLRKVKHDSYKDYSEYEDDDDEDLYNTVNVQSKKPQLQARASRGQQFRTWRHFIAAEEVTWDYAPHLQPTDSKLQSRYLAAAPHHLDYTYKKVAYVEYTDGSFTQRKNPDRALFGPVLKGKVNDEFHIIFRNLASRPYNIYPTGLTKVLPLQTAANQTDLRSAAVPPNGTLGYVWKLTADDGPLRGDHQCLSQLYQSTVAPERDLASGLVGTLLICKFDAIDTRGRLLGPDKEWSLAFAVFDENRSWYFNENMQRSSQRPVNTTDPALYKSNVIYSINGIMFSGRRFAMCQNDVIFWHVANVGTESSFLSVYFPGNPYQYQGLYHSVLTLFPMTGITVPMETELLGEWEISAFDGSLRSRGMSIQYSVRVCDTGDQLVDRDDGLEDDISDYIDQINLGPRGFRPQDRAVLAQLCKRLNNSSSRSLNASSQREEWGRSEGGGANSSRGSEGEIPKDVLQEVDRDGTEAGDTAGGRGRRQAESPQKETRDELEESNAITLNTRKSSTVEPAYSKEMDDILSENHIELERLTAAKLEDANATGLSLELDLDYDDYSPEANDTSDMLDKKDLNPRSGGTIFNTYYIAAEEITWDYGIRKPHQLIKPREMRRGMRKFLPEYKKVVFRAYTNIDFKHPADRVETDEHLGILGPFIRAEINDLLTVVFKNKASRPYSFHLHGIYDRSQAAGFTQTQTPLAPPGPPGEPVPPGEARTYNWKINKIQGPTDSEFDCKTGAYYSTVDQERDLHSGLIGPLVICKQGILHTQNSQLNVQEFSLLFHTFDETKSWYLEENLQRHCAPPCQVNTEDPWYHDSNTFAAINGYVAETLPGLLAARHQPVRWHLLNVGSSEEYHVVHFHGLPFTMQAGQEHRMGVYGLFPGVFGTVEMKPPTVGTWLVECTIGDHQLAGMRARLLVYNPQCVLPLGMKSGRIEDSQITASEHIGSWEPRLARLDLSGYINAWMGKKRVSWLQVDLLQPTLLHRVQTQGVRSKLRDNYVTYFSVSYSLDQETWTTYRGNSTNQIEGFVGNIDSSTVNENAFIPPFVARYVRIHPLKAELNAAMRVELLGCDLNSCSLPLGLQKKQIPDSGLNASSFHSSLLRSWRPSLGRLHQEGSANAWRPQNNNPHEWLQVDLGRVMRITGVITQGAKSLGIQMMVTEFSVTVSHDGRSWSSALEESSLREKIFTGNNQPDEEALTTFDPPLFGRFLRIHPRGWVNGIALRLEVLGCNTQQPL
ncbi:coagulation factor VIII [Betta splendens]|uniref:Coagulation factor VIII n=1 Tax=Betta splendens TaxID=158456 RepID=A0A6P7NSZ8_BETSP|nr:coagulation factor VIII [Betta splendens]